MSCAYSDVRVRIGPTIAQLLPCCRSLSRCALPPAASIRKYPPRASMTSACDKKLYTCLSHDNPNRLPSPGPVLHSTLLFPAAGRCPGTLDACGRRLDEGHLLRAGTFFCFFKYRVGVQSLTPGVGIRLLWRTSKKCTEQKATSVRNAKIDRS